MNDKAQAINRVLRLSYRLDTFRVLFYGNLNARLVYLGTYKMVESHDEQQSVELLHLLPTQDIVDAKLGLATTDEQPRR
jgi:hypothetical protein